jgi:signal recognition particle subunit SRP54
MFDNLGRKFEGIFRRLTGQHKLTEENIKEALREVRLALLEADVHYKVVKDFVQAVQERSVGREVLEGVNPAQQFIHGVYLELVRMLGGKVIEEPPPGQDAAAGEADVAGAEGAEGQAQPSVPAQIQAALAQAEAQGATSTSTLLAPPMIEESHSFVIQPGKSNVILMLGLQGSGKTTFCGKLARRLTRMKCRPMLVACDIYRPAAIEQLKVVGRAVGVPCFAMGTDHTPVEIIREAQKQAAQSGNDVLIVDTAGRLHIDEVRMDELRSIRDEIKPDYTFLVCDAMTGQDAVSSASTFNGEVGLDGVCLTKMDGDARGGAALSIRAVTGKPIVFVGTGERPEDLEEFIPDRIASRILGMGDVVSLVEKAQETMDAEEALRMQDKIRERKFDFDDFLKQMRSVKRMGSLKGLLGMIPGLGQMLGEVDDAELEGELKRVEAIINSMTKDERGNDEMLRKSGTRRMRVAKGSGTTLQDVTELLRQFDQAKGMMQAMLTGEMGGLGGLKKMLGGGGGMGGAMPPGMPGIPAGAAAPRGGQGPRFMKKKKKKKRKGR